jgi:hypothetical protein
VNFIEVKIPKEVRQHKESIFFGLSLRQFICSILAVAIAAGVYLGLGKVVSKDTASWLCILLAAPMAMGTISRWRVSSYPFLRRLPTRRGTFES